MSPDRPALAGLSDLHRALLILLFGVATTGIVRLVAGPGVSRLDLLLFAASSGAVVTTIGWVLMLALRRGRAWGLAMLLGAWVPYLNLVLSSIYVRRYWREDGRGPGLLGMVGLLGQTLASLRLLFPSAPPAV